MQKTVIVGTEDEFKVNGYTLKRSTLPFLAHLCVLQSKGGLMLYPGHCSLSML